MVKELQMDLFDLMVEFEHNSNDGKAFAFIKISELEKLINEYKENPLLLNSKKLINVYLVKYDAVHNLYKPVDLNVYKWNKLEEDK